MPPGVYAIVISLIRELAMQIQGEAQVLLQFHKGIRAGAFIGGQNINKDKRQLTQPLQILIATPGRLIDHIQSNQGFATMLRSTSVLVLDEADRLLDMGFRPSLETILKALPDRNSRQNLLFSATVPEGVRDISKLALQNKYEFVDCVADQNEGETNAQVKQEVLVTDSSDVIPALLRVLQLHMKDPEFKIMVFFTTARYTGFCCEFMEVLKLPLLQLHSRKSQTYRNRVSDEFRLGKRVILFTSDVSARGLDYPDVTACI
jgi:ATP-dependent RNA helicase MSS116